MFRKILFPTDFSEYSLKTLEYVIGLKDAGVKEVVLLHVMRAVEEYPISLGIQETLKKRLEEPADRLKKEGFKVKSLVEMGSPSKETLRIADEQSVSMIVAGSHGKGLAEEMFIGSISERIAREAMIPVLIVRYRVLNGLKGERLEKFSAQIFKKILYPTDFSFSSHRVFDFVRALKKAGMKEVVLSHVVDDRYLFPYRAKQAKKEAKIRLEAIKQELEERGVKAKVVVSLGAPLTEILHLSEEEDVSLIALGSHGKGYLKEVFLGSVSENVIRRSRRPVLVVHEKDLYQLYPE